MSTKKIKILLYQLSEKLSPAESNALVDIEDLPKRLLGESPFTVLMQLYMNGRFSNLDELEKIFKNINRYDIAKKVASAKKSKPQKDAECDSHVQSQPNLEACLHMVWLQFYILRDQVEQLRKAAEEAGYRHAESAVSNTQVAALKYLQRDLSDASRLIKEANNGSLSPQSSISSISSEELTTVPIPVSETSESELKSPQYVNFRTHTTPQRQGKGEVGAYPQTSTPKQLMFPPNKEQSDDELYSEPVQIRLPVTNTQEEYCYVESTQDRQPAATTQLITGAKRRTAGTVTVKPLPSPPPPPKPKQRTGKNMTSVPSIPQKPQQEELGDSSADFTDSTYTDDSGFSDAKQFIKEPLKPRQPKQQASPQTTNTYTSLSRPTMNQAEYYKTAGNQLLEEATYCDVRQEPVYVNLQPSVQKRKTVRINSA